MEIPEELSLLLKKHHYSLVGSHSAVKACHWLKKSLKNEGFCYKQAFYGIESHRCLQMTPAVAWCQQRCVFCWRPVERTLGTELAECDEPRDIVEGAMAAQRKLLSGFGGIPVDAKKFKEAQEPRHAAISLAGEPTLYGKIGGLIGEFKKKGMTTFLVTNGLLPERLEKLDPLPTQLYVSLDAWDEASHKKINVPLVKNSWNKLNETLELLPSLDTRKVIRMTLFRNGNMHEPEGYAPMIKKSGADFVEVKAFMPVGFARQRLEYSRMPSHIEIKEFAAELASALGYEAIGEKPDSRIVLLSSGNKKERIF